MLKIRILPGLTLGIFLAGVVANNVTVGQFLETIAKGRFSNVESAN